MFFYTLIIHVEIPCEISVFPMYLQAFRAKYFFIPVSLPVRGLVWVLNLLLYSPLECLDGLVGIALGLVEQTDEAAADDGP